MNILITGAWRYTASDLEAIRALGHRIWEMPDESGPLPCGYEIPEAVICNNLFNHHPLRAFTGLRYVQLTSAGYDRIPMEYVHERGMTLCNASGVYSIPMAEYALCGVLDIYKQRHFFSHNQELHRWEKHRGLRELAGKRVCILGCGSVGNECAVRFAAFGCRVEGVDILPREDSRYEAIYPVEDLASRLPYAHVLVLSLPVNEATRHIVDGHALTLLPDAAVVVNLARGGVLDTEALLAAVAQRELYAVLDVFEEEPLPPDSPLWDDPHLLLSPHNSFVGEGNAKRLTDLSLGNLRKNGSS